MLLERFLFGVMIRDELWCGGHTLEIQSNGLLSGMRMNHLGLDLEEKQREFLNVGIVRKGEICQRELQGFE